MKKPKKLPARREPQTKPHPRPAPTPAAEPKRSVARLVLAPEEAHRSWTNPARRREVLRQLSAMRRAGHDTTGILDFAKRGYSVGGIDEGPDCSCGATHEQCVTRQRKHAPKCCADCPHDLVSLHNIHRRERLRKARELRAAETAPTQVSAPEAIGLMGAPPRAEP